MEKKKIGRKVDREEHIIKYLTEENTYDIKRNKGGNLFKNSMYRSNLVKGIYTGRVQQGESSIKRIKPS